MVIQSCTYSYATDHFENQAEPKRLSFMKNMYIVY